MDGSWQILKCYKSCQNSTQTTAKIWYVDINTATAKTNIFSPTTDYEFQFSTDAQTLVKLYELIGQRLKEKRPEIITLEFPEGSMKLNFFKSLGEFYVNFHFSNMSEILDKNSNSHRETYALDQKRLDKFFGRVK